MSCTGNLGTISASKCAYLDVDNEFLDHVILDTDEKETECAAALSSIDVLKCASPGTVDEAPVQVNLREVVGGFMCAHLETVAEKFAFAAT